MIKVGVKVGLLSVAEATDQRKSGYIVWRCRCEYGKEVFLDTRSLQRGTIKDCGCSSVVAPRQRDVSGMCFGKLTAVCPTHRRGPKGSTIWNCRCDCGNEVQAELILVYLFVRTDKDFIKYARIMSLTGGFNFIINVIRTHKCVKLVKENLSVRLHIKKLLIFASGTFLIAVYRGTGVTMLGILSTKTETGCYSYAFTMIKVLAGICTAVAAVFFPRLSYYYKVNQIKFYEFLRLALKVMVFFSFPACMGIFLMAPPIVTVLLGEAFLPTAEIMRILSLLIIIWGFSNVAGYQLLLVTDNERVNIPAYFIVTVITVILDCILIPVMSGSGAALVFVSGELIVNSYLIYKVRRFIFLVISWKALGQALLSTAVMGGAVYCIMKAADTPIIQCIVGAVAGVLVYGTVNLILKNEFLLTMIDKIRVSWVSHRKDGL